MRGEVGVGGRAVAAKAVEVALRIGLYLVELGKEGGWGKRWVRICAGLYRSWKRSRWVGGERICVDL